MWWVRLGLAGVRDPNFTHASLPASPERPGIRLPGRVWENRMSVSLRFLTFLAPNMYPVYAAVARFVGQRLNLRTTLETGSSFDQLISGQGEVAFICGLPYVLLARRRPPPVELIAAPVLQGERYRGKPVYYSDVIVRRDRPWTSFAGLRGCSWAYNDPDSHSGYNVTRYRLVQMGETKGFFGQVVCAGWHQRAIRMVCHGEVDASAIDSQVLAIELRDHPELASQLKIIDVLGPAAIQPVVMLNAAPDSLKADVQAALLAMADDPASRSQLAHGFVERFAAVSDADYDGIRAMLAAAEAEDFMVLR
jgi:phosphonate transport system substrate-binding protein